MTPFSKLGSWTGQKETVSWARSLPSCVYSVSSCLLLLGLPPPSSKFERLHPQTVSQMLGISLQQKCLIQKLILLDQNQGVSKVGLPLQAWGESLFWLLVATGLAWLVASVVTITPPLCVEPSLIKHLSWHLGHPGSPPTHPCPHFSSTCKDFDLCLSL